MVMVGNLALVHRAHDLVTVNLGHREVEQQQVVLFALQHLDRLPATQRGVYAVAVHAQQSMQALQHPGIVVG
jgi:hypothetical protein